MNTAQHGSALSPWPRANRWVIAAALLILATGHQVRAQEPAPAASDAPAEAAAPEDWNLHAQFTEVTQYHPPFDSAYRGPNSLDPGHRGDETVDLTIFAGVRLWRGAEAYANAEVDQGFGLSNTLGAAGFPSAEAYKVGESYPYIRLPRAFLRQTINLGGDDQTLDPDANQLGGSRSADSIVVTLGKFSVVDIFDNNSYAHDPKGDFLNWTLVDAGAFDYAADAWGYSYGAAVEWTQSWWTMRGGLFDLSREPNSKRLVRGFSQYELVAELEERHTIADHPGKVKILAFDNRGRMANYSDAVRLAQRTGATPDVSLVRQFASRPGFSINIEQEITPDLGAFARASIDDGEKEAYEFTDVNRSLSAGLSLKGARWDRPDDVVGLGGVVNDISDAARAYFAAGGLGILVGDGRLPHYESERILEAYYSAKIVEHLTLAVDYQYIANPAYNPDRGPVNVFGFRIHADI